jgi:hypothetical protein
LNCSEVYNDYDSDTEVDEINWADSDDDETVDEEQDPKSNKDKNQFIGLDDDNLDDETMDKSDTDVLIPPDPKIAQELSKFVCLL